MASRNQRKKKLKRRQHASTATVDVLETPTTTIVRDGRFIQTFGTGDDDSVRAFRDAFVGQRADLEQQLTDNRTRILEILAAAGPAEVLAQASLNYLRMDADTYVETEDDRSPAHVEYLALQALHVGVNTPRSVEDDQASALAAEAVGLARSMFEATSTLQVIQAIEQEATGVDREVIEYQLKTRLASLAIRGTAYAEHLDLMLVGLFGPLETFLIQELGFCITDVIESHRAYTEIVMGRANARFDDAPERYSTLTKALKRAGRKGAAEGWNLPPFVQEMTPTEKKQAAGAMVTAAALIRSAEIATVTAADVASTARLPLDRVTAVLDAFTCHESDFVPAHHSLPVGAHPMTEKPVLRLDSGYLIPVPHTFFDAIRPRIEQLLANDETSWQRYARHRGKWLEGESTRLLAKAIPGAKKWIGTPWESADDNSDLDGLVSASDITFRVQCKSGKITAPVRRGAPKRMLEELNELIGSAAQQHLRMNKAIDRDGPEQIGFSSTQASALRRPIQVEVIVTLDEVTTWATQANRLTKVGVLPSDQPTPWILSLTDLMAVTDLVEHAQFAHYVIRRLRLEADGRIETHDELDWVGHYLAEGLFFDRYFADDDAPDKFRLLSYTGPIDDWYFTRSGLRSVDAPKPSFDLPPPLMLLLNRLATERPRHWLLASIALLDGDSSSHDEWSRAIARVAERLEDAGWTNATLGYRDRLGVTLWIDHLRDPSLVRKQAQSYGDNKCDEIDVPNWIVIGEARDNRLFVELITRDAVASLVACFTKPAETV